MEKEIKIPENWNDVSVGMWEKIAGINRDNPNHIQIGIDTIVAVTDLTEEDVCLLSPEQYADLLNNLEFLQEEIKGEGVEYIEINGEKYYIKEDFDKLNVGEIMSLEIIQKKYEGNIEKGMSEMLCIFLRKKENGEIETFKNSFMERAELFRNEVSINQIYKLFLFFSNGSSLSAKAMKDYLENMGEIEKIDLTSSEIPNS